MDVRMCQDCGIIPLRYNNRSGFCRGCYEKNRPRAQRGSAEWEENRIKTKEYYQATRIERVHYQKIRKFKLSLEDYHNMLREQNYACALCERRIDELGDSVLNIDHDHACCPTTRQNPITCGKCVRKLLCRGCNHGLGNFHDDPELLRRAIDYIVLHRETPLVVRNKGC